MRWIVHLLLILGVIATFLSAERSIVAEEIRPEFAMDSDPDLIIPDPIKQFSKKYKPLWLSALARPEADLQRLAAETIAEAHRVGVPELSEAQPRLIKIVTTAATHPAARAAATWALIVLESKDAAPALFEASQQHGSDLRQLIEPALARWKFEPIRAVWHQRLSDKETRHRELMLAIRGWGESGADSALPLLLSITHDPLRPSAVRMAAARAAGLLKESGLEADAERLTKTKPASIVNRLCAAALLDRHSSQVSQGLLLQLAHDSEPSVAAAALNRLNGIDHDLVVPLAEPAMQNNDANVRQQGINAYVARPTPERVSFLAKLLDDPHPTIRGNVRESLFSLAEKSELDTAIRQATTGVLAGESWRGQEQATLLLAALDHKPAAPRLVQLLESTRVEVLIASAWGLRKLAVPETLPAMLDKATRQTTSRLQSPGSPELDVQVAHLCEAFGLLKYAPAEPLLRQYVPKNIPMGEFSRGGAIWALGHLHAGVPDEPLAVLLTGRLTEPTGVMPGEWPLIRVMSAISLGRMQAKSQVASMREYLGPKVEAQKTHLAIRWAIHQLTGELLPDADPPITSQSGWFLEPLDDDQADAKP